MHVTSLLWSLAWIKVLRVCHTCTKRKLVTWCQDIHSSWSSTQNDFTDNYFLRAFSNSLSEVHLGEWPGIRKVRGYQEFAFELHWPQFPAQGFFLSWNQQGTKATPCSLQCACKSFVATKEVLQKGCWNTCVFPRGQYQKLISLHCLGWGSLVNGWNWGSGMSRCGLRQ